MRPVYLKNIASLSLSQDACTGCGMCAVVCPHRVFVMHAGKAQIVEKDRCMECGACARNCPTGAIAVDANVGCASAIIKGWLTGTEPNCDCSGGDCC